MSRVAGGARVGRVAGRLGRVVPAPLRDPAQRWGLLGWLGVGLAVRLALMPFAVSADLLAVYWRSHRIAYDAELFSSYLVNMGAHYLHALGLRATDPLTPPADAVWTDPWWWQDMAGLAPQIQTAFATAEHAPQTLFALKLPYLAADLGAGLVLLALVAACAPRRVRSAWAFWMLSPIGLYATYVFGRYEAFPVLAVLLALLAVERRRPWWGALALGIAITLRGYPLLVVPVFALLAVRGVWRQAGWAAVALAPFAAVMASNRLLAGTVGELARLQDFRTGSTFFAFTLPVDAQGQVYLFAAFLLAVYGWLAGRVWGWWPGREPDDDAGPLWVWLLVVHAGLFALATWSAHYVMWFTPFVALALARRGAWRGVLPLHLVQALLALAYTDLLGGPGTLLGLFEPVQPELATSLPNLREAFLLEPGRAEQVAGLLRTAFSVATVLLVAPGLRELVRGRPALPAEPDHGQGQRAGQPQGPGEAEGRPRGQALTDAAQQA